MVERKAALKASVALLVTHHREYLQGMETEAVVAARTIVNLLYILEILNVQQTSKLQAWIDSWPTEKRGSKESVEQQVLDMIAES